MSSDKSQSFPDYEAIKLRFVIGFNSDPVEDIPTWSLTGLRVPQASCY